MATSTARRRSGRRKAATTVTEIPDHLLAEIFLLLPATEDLARVSAACVSFRRLATDGSFLRRFRRLHAPPVLGFFDREEFHPAVPPHPSAPAARALSLAGDFTFSFLPLPRPGWIPTRRPAARALSLAGDFSFLPYNYRWDFRDVRDGRVLLERETGEDGVLKLKELVVCDPLHRRYVLLPPLPDDLAASVEDPVRIFCEPRLLPPIEEDGATEETAFRVIWSVCYKIKLHILVFSSSTGRWRAAASQGLRDLLLAKGELAKGESTMMTLHYLMWSHYACGCVYWGLMTNNDSWNDVLLVLDTRGMELSIADRPPKEWCEGGLGIVETGEDKLWTFRIIVDEAAGHDLSFIIAGSRGFSSTQWQVEKTVSLDSEYRYCILAATGRYLLLERRGFGPFEDGLRYKEYFSLDIETLQLDRLWGYRRPIWPGTQRPFLYTNFPPSLLSSPTV